MAIELSKEQSGIVDALVKGTKKKQQQTLGGYDKKIEYKRYMDSLEWHQKREKVLARCNDVCEKCCIKKARHVHHLTYERFQNEDLADLQALCLECHQLEHPDRNLKREWLVITDIANRLNVSINALMNALMAEGLIESTVISWNLNGKENMADVPTLAGETMAKKKPGRKNSGRRGTYLWDFDAVKKVAQDHVVPEKVKLDVPFLDRPTKGQLYNLAASIYGISASYNGKKCQWEFYENGHVVGTFATAGKHTYVSVPGKRGVSEFVGGVDEYLKLLNTNGVIKKTQTGELN